MHALGAVALEKLWERVKAAIPAKVSAFENDTGYQTLSSMKSTYFFPYYEKPTSFGCANGDTLDTIVANMPNNSDCSFWINATQFPSVYTEIHAVCKESGLNEAFGVVTLNKRSNVVKVKWQHYRSLFTLVNSWTSVNSKGWVGWKILIPFE